MPIAWFTGTNDWYYWMPSVMETYDMARAPRHLTLVPNWDHGLPTPIVQQTFAWLDVHLKGAPAFPRVAPLQVAVGKDGKRQACWTFAVTPGKKARRAASADLILSCGEAGNWHTRPWKTLRARISGSSCTVALPRCEMPLYISGAVTDGSGFRSSTPLVRVPPDEHAAGMAGSAAAIAMPLLYNGCEEWGGFEAAQEPYIKSRPLHPALTRRQSHSGRQSAALRPGKTPMPLLTFTPGVPHRLSCFLKAARPVSVIVETQPGFNGTSQVQRKAFPVGTGWTPVTLRFTPREALYARWHLAFEVPPHARVWLDDVELRPLASPAKAVR